MKYKLIAVDLDGTLYNDQLKITSDTLNTMIKAQEMGIRIALASGRPLPGLFHARDLLKLNEHHGMLVAYNGGKVVDTTTNEVLYDKYIRFTLLHFKFHILSLIVRKQRLYQIPMFF